MNESFGEVPDIKLHSEYIKEKELGMKKWYYLSIGLSILALSGVLYYLGENNKLINVSVPNNIQCNNTCTFDASRCPTLNDVNCNCYNNYTNNLNVNPNNTILINSS
jgi:hypothetical protein